MKTGAARFTGPLITEEIGYELWKIREGFDFVTPTGEVIRVPEGRVTDLASVPPLARSLIPKIGYWSQPAAVHDEGYRLHRLGLDNTWTRKQIDQFFMIGMMLKELEYKIPTEERKSQILYAGVRMGGLASWETTEERQERLDRLQKFNEDLY